MKTCYLTDTGKVREHNEDNLIILNNDNNEYLLAVADGMGGHKAGEVASSIAIECLKEEFNKINTIGNKNSAIKWLREKVTEINNRIFEYTGLHEESMGMGTTLVMALLTNDYLLFGNIGDSSGFVFKDKRLFKVTKDHTLVNLLISTGELTNKEAETHPKKNILMKALGAVNPAEIDVFDVEKDISGILLCSDGLTNMLSQEQIETVLNSNIKIEEKVARLITKSNNRGGSDNISIAYLEQESGES
ncbi:MAG TPA: Stp1/IreP family PP2C-type Ser/Thr phosphatase [Bacilli bacterium]|nr:Stp1/IreP family PP2C-type Ser/Thr phosphatase [Bacilli bacterium]